MLLRELVPELDEEDFTCACGAERVVMDVLTGYVDGSMAIVFLCNECASFGGLAGSGEAERHMKKVLRSMGDKGEGWEYADKDIEVGG